MTNRIKLKEEEADLMELSQEFKILPESAKLIQGIISGDLIVIKRNCLSVHCIALCCLAGLIFVLAGLIIIISKI